MVQSSAQSIRTVYTGLDLVPLASSGPHHCPVIVCVCLVVFGGISPVSGAVCLVRDAGRRDCGKFMVLTVILPHTTVAVSTKFGYLR